MPQARAASTAPIGTDCSLAPDDLARIGRGVEREGEDGAPIGLAQEDPEEALADLGNWLRP